ncbi:hypothetical protein D3C84_567910 [compost metagenome]
MLNAQSDGLIEVCTHLTDWRLLIHATHKLSVVQVELLCQLTNRPDHARAVSFRGLENQSGHFEETIVAVLQGGTLCGNRLVHRGLAVNGNVLEDDGDVSSGRVHQVDQLREVCPTCRTFEVRVLDDGELGCCAAVGALSVNQLKPRHHRPLVRSGHTIGR